MLTVGTILVVVVLVMELTVVRLPVMFGLNEMFDRSARANRVDWYEGRVCRRGDGLALRWSLDFEVDGQMGKEISAGVWKTLMQE